MGNLLRFMSFTITGFWLVGFIGCEIGVILLVLVVIALLLMVCCTLFCGIKKCNPNDFLKKETD